MLECALFLHTPASLFHPRLCYASCLKTLMQTTILYIFVVQLKQLFFDAGVCSCAYPSIVVPTLVVLCVLLENTHANYDPIHFCGAIKATIFRCWIVFLCIPQHRRSTLGCVMRFAWNQSCKLWSYWFFVVRLKQAFLALLKLVFRRYAPCILNIVLR